MKIYLYFTAVVMIIWSVSCFRRIAIPQYKMHLNQFLVLVVPMIAMFLPYTVIKASETTISSQVKTNQSDVQENTPQNDTGTSQSTQQNTATDMQGNDQQNSQTQTVRRIIR